MRVLVLVAWVVMAVSGCATEECDRLGNLCAGMCYEHQDCERGECMARCMEAYALCKRETR